jgi:hypothetical protein
VPTTVAIANEKKPCNSTPEAKKKEKPFSLYSAPKKLSKKFFSKPACSLDVFLSPLSPSPLTLPLLSRQTYDALTNVCVLCASHNKAQKRKRKDGRNHQVRK